MLTRASLVTDTLALLGDPNRRRFTAAEATVESALDEAQVQFIRLTGVYKQEFPVVTIAGQANYSLLFDGKPPLGPVVWVEDAEGNDLYQTTEDIMARLVEGWGKQQAKRARAWLRGRRDFRIIRLWPTPDTAAQEYTALAPAYPPAMSANQGAVIPDHYGPALQFYAAYKNLIRAKVEGDVQQAQLWKGEFDKIVTEAREELAQALM